MPASFINVGEPTQFTKVQKYLKHFFSRQEKKLNPWTYEMHSQEEFSGKTFVSVHS